MTSSREADAAIVALIEATGVNTHVGYVTDSDASTKTVSAPLPYAVYFGSPGSPINPRLGGTRGRAQAMQVTCVGMTHEQAKWAGDKVEAALDGARVILDGRSRRISRSDESPFVRRDDDWTRPDGGPLFMDVRRYVVAR